RDDADVRGSGHEPSSPTDYWNTTHAELHRDRVLRLILDADERLPPFDDPSFEAVREADKHDQRTSVWHGQAQQRLNRDGGEDSNDDASREATRFEPLVDRVTIHAPDGFMRARQHADDSGNDDRLCIGPGHGAPPGAEARIGARAACSRRATSSGASSWGKCPTPGMYSARRWAPNG